MVKRESIEVCIKDIHKVKNQILRWGQKLNEFVLLDSNAHANVHNKKTSNFDFVCAAIAHTEVKLYAERDAFDILDNYQKKVKDWIFGFLTYDLKNDVENLTSSNYDGLKFPALHFFQPQIIFFVKGNKLEVSYIKVNGFNIEIILEEVLNTKIEIDFKESRLHIQNRISKDTYINNVQKIRSHIKRGDFYEANFCQEFYSENAVIDPVKKYMMLNDISTPPFASFYKFDNNFLISASPERYLHKKENRVISQPIKGTAKRGKSVKEDDIIINNLRRDEKENAENIMIVDLVRNDLSKTSTFGSVKVEELCEVYSFQQVHQMISTVSSVVSEKYTPVDVIKQTFPMGSMTGAPKIRAMQFMELYESTKRGLYSGAIGYFTPNGDFDFNVVIRSILYNKELKYLSFMVGGAITYKSNPESEFEETLIKADAMFKILKHD